MTFRRKIASPTFSLIIITSTVKRPGLTSIIEQKSPTYQNSLTMCAAGFVWYIHESLRIMQV